MLMARLDLNWTLKTVRDMTGDDTRNIPSITDLLSTMVSSGWAVSGRSGSNIVLYNNVLKQMVKLNDCAKKCVFFLRQFDIVSEQDVVAVEMGSLVPHEYVVYPVRDGRTFISRPYKRKLDGMDDANHGRSSDVQKRSRI
ncbi:hypothetical protein MHBO_004935 [Bonamia ostreae]|uniref:Uncharacterized protein n=1 Tax=Bonamia ostreae TaxID=126728 RepID=A0ABV2AUN3_9EUKA